MKKLIAIMLALALILTACNLLVAEVAEPEPAYSPEPVDAVEPEEIQPEPVEIVPIEVERGSEPKSEPEPASADEAATEEERFDIQYLLGQGDDLVLFDDLRHLFGELVGYGEVQISIPHYFENGLIAHPLNVGDEPAPLTLIFVDYVRANSNTFYHFNGIDGTSTYDDVIAMFGSQPQMIRDGTDEHMFGAVKSYLYPTLVNRFVRFFFDDGGNVVAISLFAPR